MIIFIAPGGRLGNQIFQLAFLMSIARSGEICLLSKMEGALGLFLHGLRIVSIPKGFIYKLFDKILVPLAIKPLCRLHILGSIQEDDTGIRAQKGLISFVRVITGYFQSEAFIAQGVRQKLSLAPAAKERAREFITTLCVVADPQKLVFVHIRRTDYLTYFVLGKEDPSLPLSYYRKTIQWFIDNVDKPFFIFVGDDSSYVREHFDWVADKIISPHDPQTDLAIMTYCSGAILSNSTLAWWGARFIVNPLKIFAPKYWLGWKSEQWYPEGIKPQFAECVDVE